MPRRKRRSKRKQPPMIMSHAELGIAVGGDDGLCRVCGTQLYYPDEPIDGRAIICPACVLRELGEAHDEIMQARFGESAAEAYNVTLIDELSSVHTRVALADNEIKRLGLELEAYKNVNASLRLRVGEALDCHAEGKAGFQRRFHQLEQEIKALEAGGE